MTQPNQSEELRVKVNKLLDFFTEPGTGEKYLKDLENDLVELIQSKISKREQLLLDELEEAVGNAKYGEDQGFNYEQAVDDVYDFINAKRGKK